ncbi:hypothetical protein C8Q80DRAFT_717960 [Daedaleopsis nitida]|nr:hypothetical protein C8Q80DRAFT_717960 [Daedaleopsis nitida]
MPQPRPSDVPSNSAPLEQTQLSGESLVPEMIEQTQPSDVAVDGSDMSIFPTRRLPPANHALLSRPIVPPRSPDVVVPDSEGAEPTQVAEPSLPPTRRGLPSASPNASLASPTRTRHQGHLQSEDEVLRTIAAEQPSIPAVQEEEEEEEEEEDEDEEEETTVGPLEEEEEEEEVPLATMVSTEIKGKQRTTARVTASFPVSAKGRAVKAPQSPPKHTIQRDTRSMSWRNVIIPSSDPQERREDAKAAAAKATKSSKRRTPTLAKPIRAPRAAKLAARGKLRESSTEDEADDDVDEDVPDYQSDDHDAVPAEGEMDVDAPDVKPARSNKRKRTVSSTSRKVPSRSIVKEESATPLGRPAKRAKTASVLRGGLHTPTRVFALWIHDAHYYPGIVQEAVPPSKYKIKFDDETTATLDIKHVRLCQLQPGDHVLAPRNRRARVVSVPECASTGHLPEDIITVEYDDVEVEIKLSDVQLASRTITAEWSDRILTKDAITPLVRPKVSRASPTPSVVPSEGSVRGAAKQQLVKTGLVVTLSPNNPEWSHQKDTLMADIKRHGGIVLDDWTTLYTMDGTVEQKGLRWILRQDDIQWKNHKNIERVYLISDDNHQKPKYLIALALGIPCLSVNWLKALVTERGPQDWSSYMLPAGFAEPLNARVSQMVDLDWGNSHNQVKDIRENLVAAKVFAEQSILCVSSSFVPCRQKGKKNGATKKDAAEMVPRIILCMGAATVEAVADFKHASRGLDDYDYVVVPDSDFDRFPDLDVCVDVNWVKNCLISGRLLALPRQQNSQVA